MWKFTKLLLSFLKSKVIFHDTTSLYFLAQTLHTFCKSSLSKSIFSDFPLLVLKFTKFLMTKVSFSSKFGFFSVSWKIILLYFFSWNVICFWQKQQVNVQIFRLATAPIKTHRIPHVIFGTKRRASFSSNFTLLFIVMRHNSFVLSHLNLYMLWTKVAHQSANFQTFDCSHQK